MKAFAEFLDLIKNTLAVLTPITACAWMLITSYYKKEKELLLQRQGLTDEAIKRLEKIIGEIKNSFVSHQLSSKDLETKILITTKELLNLKETLKDFNTSQSEYAKAVEKRISKIETTVFNLNDKLVMIKKVK